MGLYGTYTNLVRSVLGPLIPAEKAGSQNFHNRRGVDICKPQWGMGQRVSDDASRVIVVSVIAPVIWVLATHLPVCENSCANAADSLPWNEHAISHESHRGSQDIWVTAFHTQTCVHFTCRLAFKAL